MKASGQLTDLSWFEIARMMRPSGPYYLEPILETGNPYSVIKNPYVGEENIKKGRELFRSKCGACHSPEGGGIRGDVKGVDFTAGNFSRGDSDWALYRTITKGIDNTAMPATDLSDRSAWQIVTYVRSLRRSGQELPEKPVARALLEEMRLVSADALENLSGTRDNWLSYSGSLTGHRFSALSEINKGNVAQLRVLWIYQMASSGAMVEATPLVADGVMFTSEPGNAVTAIDAYSGEVLWTYRKELPKRMPLCCGKVNRGLALAGERVFLGTLDARLVALDARSGKVVWDKEIIDYSKGYSGTAAPLAFRDKVVVGIAGGEYGIRGFIDAYDAKSGDRIWRFYTIPAPGEPGNESWAGDSWKSGGGPTWMTGSFDPELNLIYWGTGNPWPDFQGKDRKGDNLFTNSVVALNADTGRLVWYFQFTPHDEWDYDANSVPVLIDETIDGQAKKLLGIATKNGFYYVLDRRTGHFIAATEVVKQTWAERIDQAGRPIIRSDARPSKTGAVVYPGASGGANWWSPSYNPRTNLVYVPLIEQGQRFFQGPADLADSGTPALGSISTHLENDPGHTVLRALKAATGERVWEFNGKERKGWSRPGGSLATGEVVFWADLSNLYALDASNGEKLWSFNTGGKINAAPMSYAANGRQMIAIAAGNAILVFGLGGGGGM
jgi:alcohol dehydrogenase (cytochrome c)